MSEPRFSHEGTKLLFPTPLVSYRIADAERINADLLEEIAVRQKTDRGVVRSNRAGWHSESDFFLRQEPAHHAAALAIRDAVIDATRRIAGPGSTLDTTRFQINGWVNVNPPKAYNVPHDHPGSFWSGCYYVRNDPPEHGDDQGGTISFIDMRCAPTGQPIVKAPAFMGTHGAHPEPGTLLLFPSNVKHWVHPNTSATDRVTMAFNVFLFEAAKNRIGGAAGQGAARPGPKTKAPARA